MLVRSFKYKLALTKDQEETFRRYAGVCRLIYNLALEQRRDWHRQYKKLTGKPIRLFSQCSELKDLRGEFDWIAKVSQICQQQALMDLDKAFQSFHRGRSGYPEPRRKGTNDSFRFLGRDVVTSAVNAKWAYARLPKIGKVKFRLTRPVDGKVLCVNLVNDVLGWHISFSCQLDEPEKALSRPAVGIDRGIENTLYLSDGSSFSLPKTLNRLSGELSSAKRSLARKRKGSNRRVVAAKRMRKISARIRRIRRDWHQKTSRIIADRYGTVVMERLNILNMTASARGTIEAPGVRVRQKAGLSRSILNQGWGEFASILKYKLEEVGNDLIYVPPHYTSQLCSECGHIDKMNRESQAVFSCRQCGFHAHADHNAAINILRRNTASMRADERLVPLDEARTKGGDYLSETRFPGDVNKLVHRCFS